MTFQNLQVKLSLITGQFTQALNRTRLQVSRFSTLLGRATVSGSADKLIDGYEKLDDRLHKVGLGLKDIARIGAGIAISQTFYTLTRNVREATRALWSFNEALDYANVTYSALFGNSELAASFIDTLKDFSIDTIFEYTDIEGMARKLSAYGIEYQNLMYIIEGLTNIGTISGDTAALERLAVAIGQINAKGVLKAEELRQLANAYTPIYDILRDKLGLTEEQLDRVGDLGISSADAINAIIEYANEQFGATAEAAVQTITGLNNKIVDSLKVLGSDMLTPISMFYKSFAKYVADGLASLQEVYNKYGAGGLFEKLIPNKEWQERIRQVIAAISNTIKLLVANLQTFWPIISGVFGGIIDAFTLVLNVSNAIGSGLLGFIQSVNATTPAVNMLTKALVAAAAAWLFFKIQALGALVVSGLKAMLVSVANAVVLLTRALIAHPLITGLMLLGAVLVGVSANANNANSAISNLMKKLGSYSVGGKTADDILQVGDAAEDSLDKSETFWQKMKDGADDAGEAVEDASKKASKSLLSFDEVFRLQDEASDTSLDTDLSGISDLADAFSNLGAALIPEIPDLSSYANDFVSTLYNDLWDALKTIASGGATGALIGGLVGFAIGGLVTRTMAGALTGAKWGAKIGAIAGAAFAGFWTDTYKDLEASLLKIAVGGAAGTLIGGLVGMVLGAFATRTVDGALTGAKYGAMIGGLIGSGIGVFWAAATEQMSNGIEGIMVGGAAGALAGGLAGLAIGAFATRTLAGALAGAKLGAGIGGILGTMFGAFVGEAQTTFDNALGNLMVGTAEGALIGGLVGMLIGAFAVPGDRLNGALSGAKLGSKIGAVAGAALTPAILGLETNVKDSIAGMFSNIKAAAYGSFIGGLVGMILGAVVGAFAGGVGALPGAKIGATIGSAAGGLVGAFVDYLNRSGIGESISSWLSGIWTSIANWFSNLGTDIASWWKGLWDSSKWASGWSAVKKWFGDLWSGVKGWFSDLGNSIANWWDGLWGDKKEVTVTAPSVSTKGTSARGGHASGGIFNREHIARFAEGNKAEAIIPLENNTAMQPFVDAVANGLVSSLAPMLATSGGYSDMPPVYVGTLIADDAGLKQLERKLKIIRVTEERRGN